LVGNPEVTLHREATDVARISWACWSSGRFGSADGQALRKAWCSVWAWAVFFGQIVGVGKDVQLESPGWPLTPKARGYVQQRAISGSPAIGW